MNTLATRYRSFTARSGVAKRYGRHLLAGAVVVYGVLGLWLGFDVANFLIVLAAGLTILFWFAGRYPIATYILWGFVSGLTGMRDIGRPYFTRRRRWR